jgi:hypothetical protein
MWVEWYKWPDLNEKNSGIKDIPLFFESENSKKDIKSNRLNDNLNNLKEKKINSDIQLNNKIEETLDTYWCLMRYDENKSGNVYGKSNLWWSMIKRIYI